ncbi:MAG: uroporphyrinogen decarboxylase family protein [Thermoanaerobaculia bacterium]
MPFTHRERVLAALRHEEPDRVPLALWGSAYGLIDGAYTRVRKHLGLDPSGAIRMRPRRGHTVNFMDDRVLDLLDVDVRYVWSGATDLNSPLRGVGKDLFGVEFEKTGYQVHPVRFPLAEAGEAEAADYRMPDPDPLVDRPAARERARELRRSTDCALIARAPNSFGLFDQSSYLTGMERHSVEFHDNPRLVDLLADKLADFFIALYERFLDAVGPYVDVVELPGDDYAGTAGPIIDPRLFTRHYLPRWRRVIARIRGLCPHAHVTFHCDGDVTPFLPGFLEAGADVHHPLEDVPGLDMARVKREFGPRLTVLGALDIKEPLQRSDEATRAEVEKRIRALAPGGGFILAPANHVQTDIPPERLVLAFRHAREVGRYPLR